MEVDNIEQLCTVPEDECFCPSKIGSEKGKKKTDNNDNCSAWKQPINTR